MESKFPTSSVIVEQLKNKFILDIISDEDIVDAIDSPDRYTEGWQPIFLKHGLASKNSGFTPLIYDFKKFPGTIEQVITFLFVLVHIPTMYGETKVALKPSVEVYIISHIDHMIVDDPTVKANRNDHIAKLIKKKFNRNIGLGYDFSLESEYEDSYNEKFIFRRLTFTCVSFNQDKLCNE